MPFAPVLEEGSDHGNAGTSAFCTSSGDTMWVPSSALPRDILQSWCRRDSISQRNCKQYRALGSMKNGGCSKTSILKLPLNFFFSMVATLARLLSAEPRRKQHPKMTRSSPPQNHIHIQIHTAYSEQKALSMIMFSNRKFSN